MNRLRRLVRIGLAILAGFFDRTCPRKHEIMLRHATPRFLIVDGVVMPELFLRRATETTLSWRIRRGLLLKDSELDPYRDFFAFEYTLKNPKRQARIRPGLIALSVLSLWQYTIFPYCDPEPAYDNLGHLNPYHNLHYSSGEPSESERHQLAALATDKVLRNWEEV